jgi:hypothetical protein
VVERVLETATFPLSRDLALAAMTRAPEFTDADTLIL